MSYLYIASNQQHLKTGRSNYYLGFDQDPSSTIEDLSANPAVATPFKIVKQWKLSERMARTVQAYFKEERIDPDKNFFAFTQADLKKLSSLVEWQESGNPDSKYDVCSILAEVCSAIRGRLGVFGDVQEVQIRGKATFKTRETFLSFYARGDRVWLCLNLSERECLEHGLQYDHESQDISCRGISTVYSLSGLEQLWPLIMKCYKRSKDITSPLNFQFAAVRQASNHLASVVSEGGIPHQILSALQQHFDEMEDVEETQTRRYVAFRVDKTFLYCIPNKTSVKMRMNLSEQECRTYGFRYDENSHHGQCKGDKTVQNLTGMDAMWPLIAKAYQRSKSNSRPSTLTRPSRRPNMNFLEMGIPLGAWLQALPPLPNERCKVISSNRVEYEGETWSLSQLSKFLLDVDRALRPALLWQWLESTLSDLYEMAYLKKVNR